MERRRAGEPRLRLLRLRPAREGIREFRRAASLDPRNARVREALVRAHYARGEYREAAAECDAAMALGCRFEPAIMEVLDRYREPVATGLALP